MEKGGMTVPDVSLGWTIKLSVYSIYHESDPQRAVSPSSSSRVADQLHRL